MSGAKRKQVDGEGGVVRREFRNRGVTAGAAAAMTAWVGPKMAVQSAAAERKAPLADDRMRIAYAGERYQAVALTSVQPPANVRPRPSLLDSPAAMDGGIDGTW